MKHVLGFLQNHPLAMRLQQLNQLKASVIKDLPPAFANIEFSFQNEQVVVIVPNPIMANRLNSYQAILLSHAKQCVPNFNQVYLKIIIAPIK